MLPRNTPLSTREQGEYGKADELIRRVIGMQEKILDPDHPDVALVISGRARMFLQQVSGCHELCEVFLYD